MEFTVSRKSLKSTDRWVKNAEQGQVTGDVFVLSIVQDIDSRN